MSAMNSAAKSLHEKKQAQNDLTAVLTSTETAWQRTAGPYSPKNDQHDSYAARFINFAKRRNTITQSGDARYQSSVVIVQFDTRAVRKPRGSGGEYTGPFTTTWGSSFVMAQYARRHDHRHVLYHLDECEDCSGQKLHAAWCKVAAVLQAWRDFPRAVWFLYVDTDAAVAEAHFNATSVLNLLSDVAFEENKPILLNQDGPGVWCDTMLLQPGFSVGSEPFEHCLNSGTFLLLRSPVSLAFLLAWWGLAGGAKPGSRTRDTLREYDLERYVASSSPLGSESNSSSRSSSSGGLARFTHDATSSGQKRGEAFARRGGAAAAGGRGGNEGDTNVSSGAEGKGDSTGGHFFTYPVRAHWPYEQGPFHVAKHAFEKSVQVVPHPHRPFMNWVHRRPGRELPVMPWCFSHAVPARCFVDHHCVDQADKAALAERARGLQRRLLLLSNPAAAAPPATDEPNSSARAASKADGDAKGGAGDESAALRVAAAPSHAPKRKGSLNHPVSSVPLQRPQQAWYCN